jgi:hypothetical protein
MGEKGGDSRSKRRPWKGGRATATPLAGPASSLPARDGAKDMVLSIFSQSLVERGGRRVAEPEREELIRALVKGTKPGDGDGAGFPAHARRLADRALETAADRDRRRPRAASGSISPILLSPPLASSIDRAALPLLCNCKW